MLPTTYGAPRVRASPRGIVAGMALSLPLLALLLLGRLLCTGPARAVIAVLRPPRW